MLEIGYILLSIVILLLLIIGYYKWNQIIRNSTLQEVMNPPKLILPLALWCIYIMVLLFSQVLQDFTFPPRFPLLLFLPFVILMIIFYSTNKNNKAFSALPLKWTIVFQSYRILVELLLLYTFIKGLIPRAATFEGYNYDIAMGISSIFIAFTLLKNPSKNKTLLLIWNIIGIIMVLIVGIIVGSSIYLPELWGSNFPTVDKEFLTLPYFLIPGFLAPCAIFIHVISIIQIKNMTFDKTI